MSRSKTGIEIFENENFFMVETEHFHFNTSTRALPRGPEGSVNIRALACVRIGKRCFQLEQEIFPELDYQNKHVAMEAAKDWCRIVLRSLCQELRTASEEF